MVRNTSRNTVFKFLSTNIDCSYYGEDICMSVCICDDYISKVSILFKLCLIILPLVVVYKIFHTTHK